MPRPTVHLYTVCWDEDDMLGFFFRHYDPWVDRYVVYDDGSTDGSLDILRAHPKVEVRSFTRTDPESFVASHSAMQNEVWKESRGQADWVIITAIDEHLWVPGTPMRSYLAAQQQSGVTFIPAFGFDMIAAEMPNDEGRLIDRINRGQPSALFSKLSIFNPDALNETNFGMGRHYARPAGRLTLPARDELVLWHYKRLGFDRTATREQVQGARLGSKDVSNRWGHQYFWSPEEFREEWNKFDQAAVNLDRENPGSARPADEDLWWSSYSTDIRAKPLWQRILRKLRRVLVPG